MTSIDAELLLLANGQCERDAYDLLADNGLDPHPEAQSTNITTEQLEALLAEKGKQ